MRQQNPNDGREGRGGRSNQDDGRDEAPRWGDSRPDSDRNENRGRAGTGGPQTRGWEDQGQSRRGYGRAYERDLGDNRGVGFGGDGAFPGGEQSTGGLGYSGYDENEYRRGYGVGVSQGQAASGMRRRSELVGKGPKGYVRSDERIKESVSDRLSEGYLDASDIEVTVANGEVTLTGTVSDKNSRRWAEDLADGCPGVTHVENRLRVKREDIGTMTARSSS